MSESTMGHRNEGPSSQERRTTELRLLQVSPQNVAVSTNGSARRIAGLISEFSGHVERWSQWKLGQYRDAEENPTTVDGVAETGYPNPFVSATYELLNSLSTDRIPTLPLSGATLRALPFRPPNLERYDVVQVEFPWQFGFMADRVDPTTTLVYSSHNVEHQRLADLATGMIGRRLARLVRGQERRAVHEADLVICASESDLSAYERTFGVAGRGVVLPNGSTDPGGWELPDLDDGLDAVFVGSDYPPNVSAVERLISENEGVPASVSIHLVGTVCRSLPARLPDGATAHGFVDDLEQFLGGCDVALNPVVGGGGSNVKVPEYLGHGLPVVTTPFGARGFELEDGEESLIVPVDGFGEALAELATSPALLEEMSRAARALFESRYDWTVVSKAHEQAIHRTRVEATG